MIGKTTVIRQVIDKAIMRIGFEYTLYAMFNGSIIVARAILPDICSMRTAGT
jgi:hypothetical protein